MNNIVIAVLIGVVAGIIDVIPMIFQKINKTSCISAFVHYLMLGIIIPFVAWDLPPVLKGIIISLMLTTAVIIIAYRNDKKVLVPMLVMSILLGAGIGWAGGEFIGL